MGDAFASSRPRPPSALPWDAPQSWYASSQACSTPDSWDINWKPYINTKPLCKLFHQSGSGRLARDSDDPLDIQWEFANNVALFPHRVISKQNPADYVELQKDLKDKIIEDHILGSYDSELFYPSYGYGTQLSASGLGENPTLPTLLAEHKTTGILIMHQGKVVYENYTQPGVFNEYSRHKIFSATKSFVGLMAQMMISERRLNESMLITDVVPELQGSGFDGATIGDALNMRVAIKYSEVVKGEEAYRAAFDRVKDAVTKTTSTQPFFYNYSDLTKTESAFYYDSSVVQAHPSYWKDLYGVGFNPGPQNLREFLSIIKKDESRTHGDKSWQQVNYQTPVTEALAWALETILRRDESSLEAYFEEKLWSKVGQGADAMLALGNAQIPIWAGGLSATLQDLARFGEMLREGGRNKRGVQVVPADLVAKLSHPRKEFLPDGWLDCGQNYFDQFWIQHNKLRKEVMPNPRTRFSMVGVFGQYLWIYPYFNMTVVELSADAHYAAPPDRECLHDHVFHELGYLLTFGAV